MKKQLVALLLTSLSAFTQAEVLMEVDVIASSNPTAFSISTMPHSVDKELNETYHTVFRCVPNEVPTPEDTCIIQNRYSSSSTKEIRFKLVSKTGFSYSRIYYNNQLTLKPGEKLYALQR